MSFGGFLRQSTAVDVLIGPFVDSTDGDAEETGLTISQADVLLSKNGQPVAQKNDNTTCAADADGFYNCELDATDTNTVGQLTLYVHEAGALAVRHDYQVVEEAVYDISFAASATGAVPVASIAANAITATAINADAFTAAKFAADVTTEFQSGLATAAALDTVDNFLDTEVAAILAAVDTEVAAIITTLGTPAGVSLAADIAAIEAQTDDIGAAGAGLTALATQASVNAIDDFLDTEVAAILAAVDTEVATIVTAVGTTIPALIGTPVTSLAADIAVIEAQTDDIGAAGAGLTALATQASVATIDNFLDTEIGAIVTAVVTDIPALIAALNNLSAAAVNAEMVDALNVDTYAQPGQATPAATTTIRLMLAYLYKAYRNRHTQTATEYDLYNDDAVTVDQKAAVSDDATTFDRGEVATGP